MGERGSSIGSFQYKGKSTHLQPGRGRCKIREWIISNNSPMRFRQSNDFPTGRNTTLGSGRPDPGYPAISLRHGDVERMDSLFGSGRYRKLTWNHIQKLDSSALRERLFSSSYVPKSAAEPSHPLSLELSDRFDRCQAGGQIEMRYASTLYLGHLT